MMKFSETLVAWNQVEIAIFTGIAVAQTMAIGMARSSAVTHV